MGFRLRTAWGNFRWEELTGYHTYRGAAYLHIGWKRYTVSMNRSMMTEFFRASRKG